MVNAPLPPESDGALARAVWDDISGAGARRDPQLVIVSAGFDAHAADPLAQLAWNESDFAAITRAICDMAASAVLVVSCLEGGYDLTLWGARRVPMCKI